MLNLPLKTDFLLAPLMIALVSIGLFFFEPTSGNLLAFNRVQIDHVELWRIFTGHLLHTNAQHLILNLIGLTLLWALHGQYYPTSRYLMLMGYFAFFTSTAIYLFSPHLQWYVGLSGVLHGLFTIGAYYDIRHKLKSGWILLLGVSLKVGHEQWFGASQEIAALIDANVAIDAHFYGWLSGLVLIVFLLVKEGNPEPGKGNV